MDGLFMNKMAISRLNRVKNWLLFARQWHLIDAKFQLLCLKFFNSIFYDADKLGEEIARHLSGRNKPIFHPETECGDHVVVINCKDVAMHGFDWRYLSYYYNRGYPKSKANLQAWTIHEFDPCRIVHLSVYAHLGLQTPRRAHIERLHLFSEESVPEFVRKNLGRQLRQIKAIPKRSDQYTSDDRNRFPRLVKYPATHFVDWEKPISPIENYSTGGNVKK